MAISEHLSVEQQFKARIFADGLDHLSKEEMRELLVMMYETSMLRETVFKEMIGDYLSLSHAQAH